MSASRRAPGGCSLAFSRRRFASSVRRVSRGNVCLTRRRCMTQPRAYGSYTVGFSSSNPNMQLAGLQFPARNEIFGLCPSRVMSVIRTAGSPRPVCPDGADNLARGPDLVFEGQPSVVPTNIATLAALENADRPPVWVSSSVASQRAGALQRRQRRSSWDGCGATYRCSKSPPFAPLRTKPSGEP